MQIRSAVGLGTVRLGVVEFLDMEYVKNTQS